MHIRRQTAALYLELQVGFEYGKSKYLNLYQIGTKFNYKIDNYYSGQQ